MSTLRLAPPLVTQATIREQLERLADWSLNGRIEDNKLPRLLGKLSPLPEPDAMVWFVELTEAIAARDLPWWEVIPDAVGTDRDEQADAATRDRIEAALNALTPERNRT